MAEYISVDQRHVHVVPNNVPCEFVMLSFHPQSLVDLYCMNKWTLQQ